MSEYEREQHWSDKFNALSKETRFTAIAVIRAERARDLRRLRDELVRDHESQVSRLNDLIARIERDLEVEFPFDGCNAPLFTTLHPTSPNT